MGGVLSRCASIKAHLSCWRGREFTSSETFTYEFRQPYHTAEKMLLGQAREFISRMQAEARRLAYKAIGELASRTQEQGAKLTRCGLVLASGRPLPALDKILASHALIHTADGELFREALLHASDRCSLRDFTIKEKGTPGSRRRSTPSQTRRCHGFASPNWAGLLVPPGRRTKSSQRLRLGYPWFSKSSSASGAK